MLIRQSLREKIGTILDPGQTRCLAIVCLCAFGTTAEAHNPNDWGNYVYLQVIPEISSMSVTQGIDSSPISFGHLQSETSEVSDFDAKDFHYYRIPGSTWVHFAVPVDRKKDQLRWTFKECAYEVVEIDTDVFPLSMKSNHQDRYVAIHGNCGAPEMNLRFIYGNVRGLVAWSLGNFVEEDGEEIFKPYDVYVLLGEYGFGSRWPED